MDYPCEERQNQREYKVVGEKWETLYLTEKKNRKMFGQEGSQATLARPGKGSLKRKRSEVEKVNSWETEQEEKLSRVLLQWSEF
jgi:hypothetical protein